MRITRPIRFRLIRTEIIKLKNIMANAAPANKLLLIILAFFLPPLAVGLNSGFGKSFIINLILTLIFWIPGVIHALLVIL